ncbi:MAG: DUF3466 family protein [Gammaproteobacteria bacterium]|nr:DUF3466 family protein [Gammaproteobacteria bacterium]
MQILQQRKWSGRLLAVIGILSQFLYIPIMAAPYELIDLGTLGGENNYVYGINGLDEATGFSDGTIISADQIDEENPPSVCQLSNGETAFQEFCNHAYLYSNGVMTDLGDFDEFGMDTIYGFAINDSSMIVGYALAEIDDGDDETTNATHEKAFISFAGGEIEALPFPDESNDLLETLSPQQRALDISNDGKVVGYSLVGFINEAEEQNSANRPYLYDSVLDSITLLPLFYDNILLSGIARAINSNSMVVGLAQSEDENHPYHAFLWDPATPEFSIDLGTMGGDTSEAYDINDNNIIVGTADTSTVASENERLAFIYDPNAETPMMLIPEFSEHDNFVLSTAYAINNNDEVVGSAQIAAGFTLGQTAFHYDHNTQTLTNLNDMVDCSLNWELYSARDINDNGVIVGVGTVGDQIRSFMLVPTEDTTATNCTELREQEQQDFKDQYTDSTSGSVGFLGLIILFLYGVRRSQRLYSHQKPSQ